MQLWPLYAIAGACGLYTLKGIVVYLWDESMQIHTSCAGKEENNDR